MLLEFILISLEGFSGLKGATKKVVNARLCALYRGIEFAVRSLFAHKNVFMLWFNGRKPT